MHLDPKSAKAPKKSLVSERSELPDSVFTCFWRALRLMFFVHCFQGPSTMNVYLPTIKGVNILSVF